MVVASRSFTTSPPSTRRNASCAPLRSPPERERAIPVLGERGRDGRSPISSALATRQSASGRDLLQERVDAREARLRALLDAVLHRRVALLGRLEEHGLRQLRLLAEILELERLQVVLERLHEALGWLDLAELALDEAVGRAEAVVAAGPDVHLLDDGAVAPPFGDQLRIRPDGVDVRAGCIEDPLDADLELARGGDGGAHRPPFVRSTTCAKRSSRCSHVL